MTTNTATVAEIAHEIREHVVQWFLTPEEAGVFQNSDDLHPVLSSLRVLSLVLHLERTFKFEVEDGDLTPENFVSIEKLAVYVARRIG